MFTPDAQQVLALARKEADRLGHNYVGTEHLLLGIIKLGRGPAVVVLQKMGADLDGVRSTVERQVGVGAKGRVIGNIPWTPRIKKALALSGKTAKSLSHFHIGPEHLLLGLLREGGGVAAHVLRSLGIDEERARHEVLKKLDPNFDPSNPGVGVRQTYDGMALWGLWRALNPVIPPKPAQPVFRVLAGVITGFALLACGLALFAGPTGRPHVPFWVVFLWMGFGLFFLRVAWRGY